MRVFGRQLISLGFAVCATTFAASQTNVLTWHNDNWRDGLNSTETILNQSNVNSTQFGKVCAAVVDGQIFGQPLVVSANGLNTVYVATQNDSVYAINGSNCAVINSVSLLLATEEAAQCADVGGRNCHTVAPIIGILGTPVIDPVTNTIYLVSEHELTTGTCQATTKRKPNSCFFHRLHALDLTTLAEKFNGPVEIASTFQTVTFGSFNHIQRPGLLLLNGVMPNGDNGLYIGFSEMDGAGNPGVSIPSGWVLGYDAQNLTATPYNWDSTPDGEGGGVWASGAGLAAGYDSPGGNLYLYVETGDGDFTANTGGLDYGDSFVKLTPNLAVNSYFTPFSQNCLNPEDMDFGSSGVMLIPDSGATNFAVAPSKQGVIYGINRTALGGYSPPTNSTCPATGTNPSVEYFEGSSHHYYTTAASWNSEIYFIPMFQPMSKYQLNLSGNKNKMKGETPSGCILSPICTASVVKSTINFQYGTNLSISASGTTTGTAIVWVSSGNGWPTNALAPGILYAMDAEHVVSKVIPELWDSTMCPTRDQRGNATKFVLPTIANGSVYVSAMDPTDTTSTRGQLEVFGLTSAPCQ
jgi:hypothetical protein